jgi:very-short-patch-repair endonuclease
VYEEMNPMQKKNARVDALKNKWAHSNGYKLIRIWEHDINENPKKVMKLLRDELDIIDKKEDKKKRH